MEALSLTSEIVSEPSCSLALTDDSLPDDTHTLLLSALESNVLTRGSSLLPQPPPGAGLAAGLQIPPPSSLVATGGIRIHIHQQALSSPGSRGLSRPTLWTKTGDKIKSGRRAPQGHSCGRAHANTQDKHSPKQRWRQAAPLDVDSVSIWSLCKPALPLPAPLLLAYLKHGPFPSA